MSADQAISGTPSDIQFSSKIIDIGNNFDPMTYTFTAPDNGVYEIEVNATTQTQDSDSQMSVFAQKNGTTNVSAAHNYGHNGGATTVILVDAIELVVGDTIKIRIYSDTNETLEADFTRVIIKQLAGVAVFSL